MPSSRGIFPTQGSNPGLLHWQAGYLPLSHQGSPGRGYFGVSSPPPPRPPQHLPWVAEVTRMAVTQRLQSAAARRAMVAARDACSALSGLCRGPRPASPGGHRGLVHQPVEDRESEAGGRGGPRRRAGPLSFCRCPRASSPPPREGRVNEPPSSQHPRARG